MNRGEGVDIAGQLHKLEMIAIRKEFPGVVANDGIDLEVRAGDILGLLGENGAGKSTLMNILCGLHQPDGGEIRINGLPVSIRNPRESRRLGIGMVHQHFMLVSNHTVAENIAIALDETSFFSPDSVAREKMKLFADRFGLRVNPDAYIWELSAGEQQRVEILKALLGGSKLLVLDEPTSVLTPMEADELFSVVKKMASEGNSVIFITHKLDEIMVNSNRVVVLRRGKVVGNSAVSGATKTDLARMMVGREMIFQNSGSGPMPQKGTKIIDNDRPEARKHPLEGVIFSPSVLDVRDLFVNNDRDLPSVQGVSFSLSKGEILGVAGVSGNGQKELIEAISGMRNIVSGTITVEGLNSPIQSPRATFKAGIAHIPEERLRLGVVGEMSLTENSVLKDYFRSGFSGWSGLDFFAMKRRAENIITEFDVQPPCAENPIRNLSGGNIQKFLIGRELEGDPKVILAAHPTYGVDIGASQFIRKRLLQKRECGAAILLVSEDLEEILELSDRIAVIFRGKFAGLMPRDQAVIEEIGLLMAGSKVKPE